MYQLKRRYGISDTEARDLLATSACELCGEAAGARSLHVDHCHDSGEIRGVLCHACNTGLGLFRDDPVLLSKAISYIHNSRKEMYDTLGGV